MRYIAPSPLTSPSLARADPPARQVAQKQYDEALAAYHVLAPWISSMIHERR
jgi:hypothetical protein